jgi:hypothetical protein
MRFLRRPVLALILAAAIPAHAADLTRATCRDLAGLTGEEQRQLQIWLHGYYASAAQRAVIDRPKVEAALTAFRAACDKNPGLSLIGAEARAILLGESAPPSPARP